MILQRAQEMKRASPGKQEQSAPAMGPIICPGHSRPVPDLAFSRITEDGFFIISSCLDGKAMLREGKSGDWIGTFIGHKGAVWCARLNSTATQAVTGAADFTAKLWDAVTGAELQTFPHKHIVKSTVFSEDGKHIFTGGHEKKLRIFDLEKPEHATILEGHTGSINSIVCPQDSNLVLTAAAEAGVKIWDCRTNEVVKTLDTDANLSCMSMSGDRKSICTTAGKEVTFWDSSSFDKMKTFSLERDVDCVAYHPSSGKFATGSDSELWVRVYDFDDGKEIACNKGHHGPVRSLAFSPEGQTYASGSEDGTIRIWEASPGSRSAGELAPLPPPAKGEAEAAES